MCLRCINSNGLCHFGNYEVSEIDKLRDERSKLRILCSDKDSPFILNSLLVKVIDIAWVFIAIIIMSYFNFKPKAIILRQSCSHQFLQVGLILNWELFLYNFLELPVHIVMVILRFEILRNCLAAHGTSILVFHVCSHALDAKSVATR